VTLRLWFLAELGRRKKMKNVQHYRHIILQNQAEVFPFFLSQLLSAISPFPPSFPLSTYKKNINLVI
jgi:hypothetical protein